MNKQEYIGREFEAPLNEAQSRADEARREEVLSRAEDDMIKANLEVERTDHIRERNAGALRFRIKKGVRPYGGRIFPGRREGKRVLLYVDTTAGNHPLQRDEREYLEHEVEEIEVSPTATKIEWMFWKDGRPSSSWSKVHLTEDGKRTMCKRVIPTDAFQYSCKGEGDECSRCFHHHTENVSG